MSLSKILKLYQGHLVNIIIFTKFGKVLRKFFLFNDFVETKTKCILLCIIIIGIFSQNLKDVVFYITKIIAREYAVIFEKYKPFQALYHETTLQFWVAISHVLKFCHQNTEVSKIYMRWCFQSSLWWQRSCSGYMQFGEVW